MEFYPDLYERILKREPNVDLVMLYWDTDMFRSSKQGQKFGQDKGKNFKKMFAEEMQKAAINPDDYPGYRLAKKIYARTSDATTDKTYQKLYQMLIAGDPKERTYRNLIAQTYRDSQYCYMKANERKK